MLQPERGRRVGELAVQSGGRFPGIDPAGCLRHDGSAVEIRGIAEERGSGLSQALNDGPVDRSGTRQRGKQAAVKAVDARAERRRGRTGAGSRRYRRRVPPGPGRRREPARPRGDWNDGTFTTGRPAMLAGQGRPPAAPAKASSVSARMRPGCQAWFCSRA